MFYWMIVGLVVAHRPMTPTPDDLSLVAHGFPMLAMAVSVIFWMSVSVRGY